MKSTFHIINFTFPARVGHQYTASDFDENEQLIVDDDDVFADSQPANDVAEDVFHLDPPVLESQLHPGTIFKKKVLSSNNANVH